MGVGIVKKRRIRNDIIFIAALVLISGLTGLCFYLFRGDADVASVTVDGKPYGEFSLSENRTVEIVSENGRNVLVIKDGEARVESASCPDGICSAHKPISRDGESIVCLPNKVVITVETAGGKDVPDVIA